MPFARSLFALVLCLASLVSAGDDEIVKEFKRYFKKYKDSATRVEAILALEGTDTVGVARVLIPVLEDSEPEVVDAAVRVLGGFESRAPIDYLLEELTDARDPEIQIGLLRSIERGAYANVREVVTPLLEDSEWEVRRRALQALVGTVGPDSAETILPLCEDREAAVRCAAFDGLATLRSKLVVEPALESLDADSWQVRASAIAALGAVRARDGIGPLIARMDEEEGRLVEDIGGSLEAITGQDFGQRLELWQRFWKRYSETFVLPTDTELARLRERQRERREAYAGAPGEAKFHGVATPSRSILFVIDVSGSMEQEVADKVRYEGGGYPSFQRIDIVKTELQRTIDGLESYVEFNIIAFATRVRAWKKSLVKANPLNRSSAETFIDRLEAIGGSSKHGLASAGLVGSANLEEGKTNTYAALMRALLGEDGDRDDYEVDVDTVFFLSDGRPSTGEFIDTDDILDQVRTVNELRRVVIHALAIGEFEKDFMRRLATENSGVFVDLGQ